MTEPLTPAEEVAYGYRKPTPEETERADLIRYRAALTEIASITNLSDDRLSSRTGANDAVARGLMLIRMRYAARKALNLTGDTVRDPETFAARVGQWMMVCFDMETCRNKMERNHRFLEEALELVQSCGCTVSEAHQLVDYVFGRPIGDPVQETGGVMVTLAALCNANGLNLDECAEKELARIWTKIEQIRVKHAGKPAHSPLPGPNTNGRVYAPGVLQKAFTPGVLQKAFTPGVPTTVRKGDGTPLVMPQGSVELQEVDGVLTTVLTKMGAEFLKANGIKLE